MQVAFDPTRLLNVSFAMPSTSALEGAYAPPLLGSRRLISSGCSGNPAIILAVNVFTNRAREMTSGRRRIAPSSFAIEMLLESCCRRTAIAAQAANVIVERS